MKKLPGQIWLIIGGLLIGVLLGVVVFVPKASPVDAPVASPSPTPSSAPTETPTLAPTSTPAPTVVAPIAEFTARITKKSFGTYVTPQNSPVSPEKFTGYHTAVDVEYTDVTTDVPVVAIAEGVVGTSSRVSGYGGVTIIKHQIKGEIWYAIYGHLRQSSMLAVGTVVAQGQQIGLLGTGYSAETDNERRHLHFGIAKTPTLAGYVKAQTLLYGSWIDPLSLYTE